MFRLTRFVRRLRVCGSDGVIVASLTALIWIGLGHFTRYDFSTQVASWRDGPTTYVYQPLPGDEFDGVLYQEIRSVADAAAHIQTRVSPATETQTMQAVYDLVRRRFRHFMYPRHTWRTNPILKFLEVVDPEGMFDSMELADVKLRHSAVAPCGGAATTVIEIYRRLGGQAQFVGFDGHAVAEVIADERVYLVDANLEALISVPAEELAANPDLLDRYYPHLTSTHRRQLARIYATPAIRMGYHGAPSGNPRVYAVQRWVEGLKWGVPATALLGAILCRLRRRPDRSVPVSQVESLDGESSMTGVGKTQCADSSFVLAGPPTESGWFPDQPPDAPDRSNVGQSPGAGRLDPRRDQTGKHNMRSP